MPMRDTINEWGWFSRLLHWGMAALVFALIGVGFVMTDLKPSPNTISIYNLHKSTGLLVLALLVLRLLWRSRNRPPALPGTLPRWQHWASRISHGLLYLSLLAIPISGWVMHSASGYPLRWFGLFKVPALVGKDSGLKHAAEDWHEASVYVLLVLLVIHIGAALKHHFIDRDDVLRRMLFGQGHRWHDRL